MNNKWHMFWYLALLFCFCSNSCAAELRQVNILYCQVDASGRYTSTYWFTGKIYSYPTQHLAGMVIADQEDVDQYVAKNSPASQLPRKFDNIPWGYYHVVINGYSLPAESFREWIGIRTCWIPGLP